MSVPKKLLFSLSFFFFLLVVSVVSDRAFGLLLSKKSAGKGLVFPPNTQVTYKTPEFTFTVTINSLGFRDREFNPDKGPTTRVLAIGDSVTYGWGVELEKSWPKILESNLRNKNFKIEVANLGKPNGAPDTYADIAERAIPTMKPDLVIVGVDQGDDLAQLAPRPVSSSAGDQGKISAFANAILWKLYPHLSKYLQDRELRRPLNDLRRESVKGLVAKMTSEEKLRFERLEPRVKEAFVNGDLNPGLLNIVISDPDYLLKTLDLSKPDVQTLVSEMGRHLSRIKKIADSYGCAVVIVSIPIRVYSNQRDLEFTQRLGFSVLPSMIESKSPDDAIRKASESANLRFYEITDRFRELAGRDRLFFELDGHPNEKGYKAIADLLSPLIEAELSDRKSAVLNK